MSGTGEVASRTKSSAGFPQSAPTLIMYTFCDSFFIHACTLCDSDACIINAWGLQKSFQAICQNIGQAGLSTLPDNPGDSRFLTISPGLQSYVCSLPDKCGSLLFVVDLTF